MRILEIINSNRKYIERATSEPKRDNKTIKLSKSALEALEEMPNIMENYRKIFTQDKKYEDGFIQKSVKSAFNDYKYKKKLDEYIKTKVKNKNSSFEGNLTFECYEKLNEDLNYLDEIFYLVNKGLKIIINDIKLNYTADIDLVSSTATLIARLSQLYNIYGNYLIDINAPAQYTVFYNLFACILRILEESIFSQLKGDIKDEKKKL